MQQRQVVLDTETTGLNLSEGHRIIEIGGVELVNRRATSRFFHCYLNPGRAIDAEAFAIHGIDDAFLATQPAFADVAQSLLDFVRGVEVVIYNAEFDVAFLDREYELAGASRRIGECCTFVDTLTLARRTLPGQRHSLDALADRYHVSRAGRQHHGALIDAQILAEVYLAMTGGQRSLSLEGEAKPGDVVSGFAVKDIDRKGLVLRVLQPSDDELRAHEAMLATMRRWSGRPTLWERKILSSRSQLVSDEKLPTKRDQGPASAA